MKKSRVLVIIPARGGSKRIPNKNIRLFVGKPLIAHTIEQALALPFADRVIVDTDSEEIAKVARQYGAEVPFLRPAHLANDTSQVVDSTLYLLKKLAGHGYKPDYVLLLQTTSPLREKEDVVATWKLMQKSGATTTACVCPTHPQLYYLGKRGELALVNRPHKYSTNTQAWRGAYILNGSFAYIVDVKALKREKRIITKKTFAHVCPKWRSVDLDTPEEWIVGELLFKNKDVIRKRLANFK